MPVSYSQQVHALRQAYELLQNPVTIGWAYAPPRKKAQAAWHVALRIDIAGHSPVYAHGVSHNKKSAKELAYANIYPKLPKPPYPQPLYLKPRSFHGLHQVSTRSPKPVAGEDSQAL